MNDLAITTDTNLALDSLIDQARDDAAKSKSNNTKRAYAADWCHFIGWCGDHGQDA